MLAPKEYQHFNRFLDRLDDYLYDQGWYTNGEYIKQKCKDYQEVETYLTEHCYGAFESKRIVEQIKSEITCILQGT